MGFFDDAISSMGQSLAQTAVTDLSASTGVDVGGTLAYLFGPAQNPQDPGGTNMAALGPAIQTAFGDDQQTLSLLQADLGQQAQAIAALGAQLTGIADTLSLITGAIANIQSLLQQIQQEQLFENWQAVDIEMTNDISAINTAFSTYGQYLATFHPDPPNLTTTLTEIEELVSNILDVNVGPKDGLTKIHNFILDSGQSKGVLQLWSAMVTPLVAGGLLDYRLAVQQYFQYYQKLAFAQLTATNLLMEAYNFNGDSVNAAASWNQYKRQILAQEDTFITWLFPLVQAGVYGGLNPSSGGANFTAFDASMQINPGAQMVQGDANPGDAFYAPSSIFAAAEQLLANLYLTSPSDRRIVVHMGYPSVPGMTSVLDHLNLTLTPDGTQQTINAVSGNRLGAPFVVLPPPGGAGEYPDENASSAYFLGGGGYYLKRYVFTDQSFGGLVDDSYTLTSLNGQDGLVPMFTYLNPGAPFQQDSVVNYILQVNAAQQADFMNFEAYSTPLLWPA
jgi:hypothetical protein